MRLYDANRPCSKCGGMSVGSFYMSPHMERRCARCGYKWWERPLDQRTSEDGPPPEATTDAKGVGSEGIGVFRMNPRD